LILRSKNVEKSLSSNVCKIVYNLLAENATLRKVISQIEVVNKRLELLIRTSRKLYGKVGIDYEENLSPKNLMHLFIKHCIVVFLKRNHIEKLT